MRELRGTIGEPLVLAAHNPISDVADHVGTKDAPEVTDEQPIGQCREVELLRHMRVDVAAHGPVDEAVPQHHQERAQGRQARHPCEEERDPDQVEDGVHQGVPRRQLVAHPAAQQPAEHVCGVVGRKEAVGVHDDAEAHCHGLLIVKIERNTWGEARKGKHVHHRGDGVVPELREPPPELPDVVDELPQADLPLGRGAGVVRDHGYPQRQDQHAEEEPDGDAQVDRGHRELKRRAHEEEPAHQDQRDAHGNSEDGNVLGAMPKRSEASEQVRLKAPDADATQGIGKDHPAEAVGLQDHDHHGNDQHREHHGGHRQVDPLPGGYAAEEDVVGEAEDEVRYVESGDGHAEVVGEAGAVVLDLEGRLDIVLQPEERGVAAEERRDHEEGLPISPSGPPRGRARRHVPRVQQHLRHVARQRTGRPASRLRCSRCPALLEACAIEVEDPAHRSGAKLRRPTALGPLWAARGRLFTKAPRQRTRTGARSRRLGRQPGPPLLGRDVRGSERRHVSGRAQ
mmetsp:Transcript_603/g.1993  ORF Transcript_603/g.1993 Transcript_603/m.1993 type:complete len:512 (-) Transcript_603:57-1592(-)